MNFSDLERYVLPRVTGALLLQMHKEGIDLRRAFKRLPEGAELQVVELTLQIASQCKRSLRSYLLWPMLSLVDLFVDTRHETPPPQPESNLVLFFTALLGGFSGSFALPAFMVIVIPRSVALIAPEHAATYSFLMVGLTNCGGVLMPLVGDASDRWRDFRWLTSFCAWLTFGSVAAMGLVVYYRDALGAMALPTFATCSLCFGFSSQSVAALQATLLGVYSVVWPQNAPIYGALVSVGTSVVNAVGMIVIGSLPLSETHHEAFYATLGAIAAGELVMQVCLPAHLQRPHELLDNDDASISAADAPSTDTRRRRQSGSCGPVGALVCDFASEEYRPLLMIVCATTGLFLAFSFNASVSVYFLEDHTTLGHVAGASDGWLGNVQSAGMLLMALLAIPGGHALGKLNRPLPALVAFLFVTALTSPMYLIAPVSLSGAMAGVLVSSTALSISIMFILPAFMAVAVNVERVGRDMNTLWGIAAVAPALLAAVVSPLLEVFGAETVDGRDRPRYALVGYECIYFGGATLALLGGVAVWYAHCITRRAMRMALRKLGYSQGDDLL